MNAENESNANVSGSGASAQSGGVAAGAGGVAVGGDVHGNIMVNNNTIHWSPPKPLDEATIVAGIALLQRIPTEEIPAPGPLPDGSRVPYRPNPLFVGREAELRRIARAMRQSGGAVAIGQVATTGIGGMGKTQLASEFAHRYGRYFAGGVFWLNCGTPEAMATEVALCGGMDGLALWPPYAAPPLEEQVALVRRAWSSPLPRLLIFDNCEDEEVLEQWRPPSGGCRVLITSRRGHWSEVLGVDDFTLDTLARSESIDLLSRMIGE
jgi:hypothetical protein